MSNRDSNEEGHWDLGFANKFHTMSSSSVQSILSTGGGVHRKNRALNLRGFKKGCRYPTARGNPFVPPLITILAGKLKLK